MSFYEMPKVDQASMLSEESVGAIRNMFNRERGFLVRESNPDYGVNLELELISPEGTATNFLVPVQIKSKKTNVKHITINDTQFISYSFSTSRLGYLSRRVPSYGMVLFYNGTSKRIYFDLVENLILSPLQKVRIIKKWKILDEIFVF